MIDFVVVGPGRSGTTWLYELFRSCDEVQLARNIKEPEFFNTNYSRGIGWYSHLYNRFKDTSKTYGDLSNMYIMSDMAIERLANDFPEVKVILMLREPKSKLRSLYFFKQREGLFNGSIKEFSESDFFRDYLEEIDYARHLQLLLEKFSRERIYLCSYTMLNEKPDQLIQELNSFLNLKSLGLNFVNKRINASIVPKYFWAGKAAKRFAIILRSLGAFTILTKLKRSDKVKRIFFKSINSEQLDLRELSSDSLEKIQDKNDHLKELMKKEKWIQIDWI